MYSRIDKKQTTIDQLKFGEQFLTDIEPFAEKEGRLDLEVTLNHVYKNLGQSDAIGHLVVDMIEIPNQKLDYKVDKNDNVKILSKHTQYIFDKNVKVYRVKFYKNLKNMPLD